MIRVVDLSAVPNQEVMFPINGEAWRLRLFAADNVLCCDAYLDDEIVVLGARVVPGEPIIRYSDGEIGGNFYLATENEEYPDWRYLGGKHLLVYTDD